MGRIMVRERKTISGMGRRMIALEWRASMLGSWVKIGVFDPKSAFEMRMMEKEKVKLYRTND